MKPLAASFAALLLAAAPALAEDAEEAAPPPPAPTETANGAEPDAEKTKPACDKGISMSPDELVASLGASGSGC